MMNSEGATMDCNDLLKTVVLPTVAAGSLLFISFVLF
jgi:hypothetical protein